MVKYFMLVLVWMRRFSLTNFIYFQGTTFKRLFFFFFFFFWVQPYFKNKENKQIEISSSNEN